MNFGLETFRELIEDFLASSGGRRGRQREQRRQQRAESADDAGATSAQAGEAAGDDASADEEATEDTESESESGASDSSDGGLFGGSSSSGDEDLDDLYYRIEELEDELEEKSSKLGSVQDSQQQVADQVEEMNDRVRQLLGVYDQVTDDVNPFTGEGEAQNGFGVFGEDEADAGETAGGFGADGTGFESATESMADDETVSFDDLKGVIEDAAEQAADGGREITFDEEERFDDGDGTDTRVEVQATESVDEPAAGADSSETAGDRADDPDGPNDVTLTTLADTYATDIIVFEWLTHLVRTGGSAATLRAISYYAEIGWIGEDVREHLEGVLSGPDLDIHVDPETPPDELTAEDHADSYTYIMKLQEIHETKREVEPDRTTESGPGS